MFGRELNILFWNLYKKDLYHPLSIIAKEQNADIVIVVEAENLDRNALLLGLDSEFYDANDLSQSDKVSFFTKFEPEFIKPISEDNRYSFRLLKLPLTKEIILGGVHLLDQRSYSESSRRSYASSVKNEIDSIETERGINNSVIIGDFNMNPFEQGMNNADGFHAISSKAVALGKKKILGTEYSYFYNPSWSLMGDLYYQPAGTYYYNKPGYDSFYWNVLDQAIIRPSLIGNFDHESYKIITHYGKNSLLTPKGLPNKKTYSDHLPITLTFKNL